MSSIVNLRPDQRRITNDEAGVVKLGLAFQRTAKAARELGLDRTKTLDDVAACIRRRFPDLDARIVQRGIDIAHQGWTE